MKVNVVEVPVPTGRQRARNIGGNVIDEMKLDTLRTDSEERVLFEHTYSGAPGYDSKLIGINPLLRMD
jgi:hypothetical protein